MGKGSKSFPKEMGDHLAKELQALKDSRFAGWSQERVGQALGGISQTQMSLLLKGLNWGPTTVLKLSEHSGKTITELLGPTAPHYDKTNQPIALKVRELLDLLDQTDRAFSGKFRRITELIVELRSIVGRTPTAAEDKQREIREVAVHSPLGKGKRGKRPALPEKKPIALLLPASEREKVGT